jgi:hypothetical protein
LELITERIYNGFIFTRTPIIMVGNANGFVVLIRTLRILRRNKAKMFAEYLPTKR